MSAEKPSPAQKLRHLLSKPEILVMPCCYDGLTARLVEDAGFTSTFMTGFGVSAAHGMPDTQARDKRCTRYHVYDTVCFVLSSLFLNAPRGDDTKRNHTPHTQNNQNEKKTGSLRSQDELSAPHAPQVPCLT